MFQTACMFVRQQFKRFQLTVYYWYRDVCEMKETLDECVTTTALSQKELDSVSQNHAKYTDLLHDCYNAIGIGAADIKEDREWKTVTRRVEMLWEKTGNEVDSQKTTVRTDVQMESMSRQALRSILIPEPVYVVCSIAELRHLYRTYYPDFKFFYGSKEWKCKCHSCVSFAQHPPKRRRT